MVLMAVWGLASSEAGWAAQEKAKLLTAHVDINITPGKSSSAPPDT